MKEFKICENCKKAAFCHSTCGAMFGFCAAGFEPCTEYTLYRKTSGTRDDIGLPYVFRTLNDFQAWCEDNEEQNAKYEKAVLPMREYVLVLRAAETWEELNPYEYDRDQVALDGALYSWLIDRAGMVEYFTENECYDIAKEIESMPWYVLRTSDSELSAMINADDKKFSSRFAAEVDIEDWRDVYSKDGEELPPVWVEEF